jgi:antirestriction protein ArdC
MDGNFFGSHDYSKEELIAEMGSVFLCNEIGIDATFDNSLAYLKSWLGKLKDDVKLLITAAGKAQKAVDYILEGVSKGEDADENE